jgi:co-chaperonin GroES (HSP10)
MLHINEKDIRKIILIGDRVLIKPSKPTQRTESGLYLPQGIHKKEVLHTGYVLKVGPGYPIPALQDVDEPWKEEREEVKYVPLQPKAGDLAVYHQKGALDIEFNHEKYIVIPHSALVLLIREDDLID